MGKKGKKVDIKELGEELFDFNDRQIKKKKKKKKKGKKVRQNVKIIGTEKLNEKLESLFSAFNEYTGVEIEGFTRFGDGSIYLNITFWDMWGGKKEYLVELGS